MLVLLILIISCLIFRGFGFAGIAAFATWQASARDALSLMLVFTGVSHFTFMNEDFVRMMPPSIPWPRALVYFTGVCEIAGAIGLLLPEFRRAASYALIAFFLAVLPANIHAARAGVALRGKPATRLWLRIPMQILFITVAFWSAYPFW
ncbi:MAG TPA: DoxX family protein [Candidatus Acidoferrales bacterium]|nr:DoxX family protein [Candidatus Acidoferrales bacterium]